MNGISIELRCPRRFPETLLVICKRGTYVDLSRFTICSQKWNQPVSWLWRIGVILTPIPLTKDDQNCINCLFMTGRKTRAAKQRIARQLLSLNIANFTEVFGTKGSVKWSVRNYRPHHGRGKNSPIIAST
jgi:hypothetical protein